MDVNEFNAFEKIFNYQDKLHLFFNKHKTLISLELDLTNKCNHKCPKCTGIRDKPVSQSFKQVKQLVDELYSDFETKSIIISGGGEPLLHPDFIDILYYIKNHGIKIGLNSNGSSLNEEKAKAIIDCCTYFRISLDAGTPKMYNITHGMPPTAFYKVTNNIKKFVELKKGLNSQISFGTGFLTNDITKQDIQNFFRLSKELGVDFAQLRPFSNDFASIGDEFENGRKKFEDSKFQIRSSIHKYQKFADKNKRPYSQCLGIFFNTVITADFKVYACIHHRQNPKYLLGDLNETTLKQIWESARIREVLDKINFQDCPYFCRNDDINRGLEFISKPRIHKEFL